jgi:hypothetical protein
VYQLSIQSFCTFFRLNPAFPSSAGVAFVTIRRSGDEPQFAVKINCSLHHSRHVADTVASCPGDQPHHCRRAANTTGQGLHHQHSGNTPPHRAPPGGVRLALGDPKLAYHTARTSQNTTGYSSLRYKTVSAQWSCRRRTVWAPFVQVLTLSLACPTP